MTRTKYNTFYITSPFIIISIVVRPKTTKWGTSERGIKKMSSKLESKDPFTSSGKNQTSNLSAEMLRRSDSRAKSNYVGSLAKIDGWK